MTIKYRQMPLRANQMRLHSNRTNQVTRRTARRRLYLTLAMFDALSILVSFLIAHFTYDSARPIATWAEICTVVLPIYFAFALNADAYSVKILQPGSGAIRRAVQSYALTIAVVVLVGFFLKASATYSRGMFFIGSLLGVISISVFRDIFLRRARAILGVNPINTVIIHDGAVPALSDSSITYMSTDDWFDPEIHSPEMYDLLSQRLKNADRVVVACAEERRVSWVRALKGANIRSELLIPELLDLQPLGISACAAVPTLIVAEGPLSPVDVVVKRCFDIVVAGIAVIALLPILIVVALAIRWESPGPILFVQTRIGCGNALFRMFKFRSMRIEQSDHGGAVSARRDDDRITRVGAFIRRTSIDELPQLLNVLRGDMSIVGPRPHALESRAADKLFWEVDGRYFHRHAAKPGLTGLAQIRGYRGATEYETDLTDRLQADLEYLAHWSIWRDLKIVLRTFTVIMHRNAF
jgi:polysaccharide biosynthesis protein PslA